MSDQTPTQSQPIDLSAGLVPDAPISTNQPQKVGASRSAPIDLSAGLVPTETPAQPHDPNARFNSPVGTITGGTISATPQPTTYLGRFGQWAENVSNDIKNGTDNTGIGTVLKKMGNHGVYSGNSEALGDFMASLPLGLLKAGKGTTELAPQVIGGPKGRTVQGLKDVIGGGLQAAQIPSAFVAPEAATEKGVADVAGNTGRVQQTIANLAKDAGGIEKDIAPTAADPYGFRQVASEQIGKYKAAAKKLDELSHDAFSDAQQDVEDAADDFTAAGKKAYREAQQKLNDIITKYKPALKDAGVDADSMKADYRKGMANNKIATFLNKTTEETGKDVMQATAKAGSGLKEALLDLAQNQKDLLSRAGWQDAHINQAVQSARELIPSVTQRVVNAVTKHAGLGVATALGGAAGGLVAKEVVK